MNALDGVKVVDFTAIMSGPTCTLQLADFGAEVIKIEPPNGDGSRHWGRHRFGEDDQFSALFLAMNRNKRGLTLDLKSEEGKRAVRELLEPADVVVENYKPGVADRLGIGYEAVRSYNPAVIYCSISGFGQNGPLRDRPGLDMLMQAYTGHMSITGEEGGPSVRTGPSPIDFLTGTNAALGIMMALFHRQRTGQGQYLETSLYDAGLQLMTHYIADYSGSGVLPRKSGPFFAFDVPYGVFQAQDREFYMGVSNERSYAKLCDLIERPDLLADPRFATNALRIQHREQMHELIMPIFRTRPAAVWVAGLIERGVPASLIDTLAEVVAHEQAAAREMLLPTGIDGMVCAGTPVKMHGTPAEVRYPAPTLARPAALAD